MLLGVVGDEPVNKTEGGIGCTLEQLNNVFLVIARRIELLQAVHDELLLAMNLSATGLWVRIHCHNRKIVHLVLILKGQKS